MAEDNQPKITVRRNGPYSVRGQVPLVRKEPVMSEHGEPLTWKKGETLPTGFGYILCRCGQSAAKPFCDGTHEDLDFDGTETADTNEIVQRETGYEGSSLVLKDDRSLCMHAGFCGNRVSNVWEMIKDSEDTQVRAQIIAMVEKCPSGALAFSLSPQDENVEPSLPMEIAVTLDGALWVSGGVPIERYDGQPFETRNRVTLCRCGASSKKPLCDGSHKEIGFSDP